MEPEQLAQEILEATDQSPEQVVSDLRSLSSHQGWIQLVRYFDQKIESLEEQILETDVTGHELDILRYRRNMTLQFRNLPEILVTSLTTPEIADAQSLDPYAEVLNEGEE